MYVGDVVHAEVERDFVAQAVREVQVGHEFCAIDEFILYVFVLIGIGGHHGGDTGAVFAVSQQGYFAKVVEACADAEFSEPVFEVGADFYRGRGSQDEPLFAVAEEGSAMAFRVVEPIGHVDLVNGHFLEVGGQQGAQGVVAEALVVVEHQVNALVGGVDGIGKELRQTNAQAAQRAGQGGVEAAVVGAELPG